MLVCSLRRDMRPRDLAPSLAPKRSFSVSHLMHALTYATLRPAAYTGGPRGTVRPAAAAAFAAAPYAASAHQTRTLAASGDRCDWEEDCRASPFIMHASAGKSLEVMTACTRLGGVCCRFLTGRHRLGSRGAAMGLPALLHSCMPW